MAGALWCWLVAAVIAAAVEGAITNTTPYSCTLQLNGQSCEQYAGTTSCKFSNGQSASVILSNPTTYSNTVAYSFRLSERNSVSGKFWAPVGPTVQFSSPFAYSLHVPFPDQVYDFPMVLSDSSWPNMLQCQSGSLCDGGCTFQVGGYWDGWCCMEVQYGGSCDTGDWDFYLNKSSNQLTAKATNSPPTAFFSLTVLKDLLANGTSFTSGSGDWGHLTVQHGDGPLPYDGSDMFSADCHWHLPPTPAPSMAPSSGPDVWLHDPVTASVVFGVITLVVLLLLLVLYRRFCRYKATPEQQPLVTAAGVV